MKKDLLIARRRLDRFVADSRRVITRPFRPGSETRIRKVIQRVLGLSESDVERVLKRVLDDFSHRHKNIKEVFRRHFAHVREYLPDDVKLSLAQRQLIGSYFTLEYSVESAAFFNPSIILHPNQNGLPEGSARFVLSFRATGEGHVSSIAFRVGVIDREHNIELAPVSRYVEPGEVVENPSYDRDLFASKLKELGFDNPITRDVIAELTEIFTFRQLEDAIWYFGEKHNAQATNPTIKTVKWLARSNYELRFRKETKLSERLIFPVSPNERKGIEDARFVRFTDEDGSVIYYATYTAYDGFTILPQVIETRDFLNFEIYTLNGSAAQNKGMALFPRKVDGNYMAIGRIDGENLYIMESDNLHFWHEAKLLQDPQEPWEFMQIGNCGSPIETEAGWLLLTHGVGPMRTYSIGVMLLDLEDPTKVIGRFREPIMRPDEEEREGYVPNVVYSCGAMIHNRELILPYAMSDSASGIATLDVDELLRRLQVNNGIPDVVAEPEPESGESADGE